MAALTPKVLHALLERAAGRYPGTILTAIALAETGGELTTVQGNLRGPWLISDDRGYDRQRLVTDAAYAAAVTWEISLREGYNGWLSYRSERYREFLNAARQGAAQAASVTGSILTEDGTYVPPSFYAPAVGAPAPGVVTSLAAAYEQDGPLTGLRVTGTEMTGDISSIVIGAPTYEAGWTTVPNLSFDIADPEGNLLWQQRNLWVRGACVEYLDLDLRIDELEFSPGPANTGQISITAIDNIIYQLQLLRGARTASNVSATTWIRQELSLAGLNPDVCFLGEALPSQTEIARDIPDQSGSAGSGDAPSAWTTIQRLAKETGKRVFVSGRKLIFGSARFAMDWCSPGDLRIGWHDSPEGERWQTLPSGKSTSVGDRSGVTEVSGRVPLNRARFFRPGASVIVHNTPSIAAGDRRFVVASISHTLSRDVDGADVMLIEPVELTAEVRT